MILVHIVCTGSGSEVTRSNSTDTSDIDTTITDRTNLSNDGTEKTDRGIDDTGGIKQHEHLCFMILV